MLDQIWAYLPAYDTWTIGDFLMHLGWGMFGAFIRLTHSNAPMQRPTIGEEGLQLNAVGEFLVASGCGMMANTHPGIAAVVAFAMPDILEEISKIIQEGIRHRLRRLLLGNGEK